LPSQLNTNSTEGLGYFQEGLDMAFATIEDLLEVDATLQDYGIQDFDAELVKAEADVTKIIKVRWWPTYLKENGRNANDYDMNATLLDPAQWTQVTCYYALAFYILPKLSKFEADPDRFRNMMDYYASRFEALIDLELRSGVRYDADNDDQFETTEVTKTSSLRLVR
jgi:hypothetical protein